MAHKPHACRHFAPLLGYCDHQIHQLMDRRLREYDVSPMQCRALGFLQDAGGDVTQKALEQFLMVKPSTVNGIVRRLEEKGLIVRTTAAQDGRCRILTLTEQGRSFNEAFRAIISSVEQQMEQGFSAQEISALRELLLRVADNLTQSLKEVDA